MLRNFNFSVYFALVGLIGATACSEDNDLPQDPNVVKAPSSYSFSRNDSSTVAFSGQTTRLAMAEELKAALLDFNQDAATLRQMFANEDSLGQNVDPFQDPALNAATKSIRSKTAASYDYFNSNVAESQAIKQTFDAWLEAQVNEVFPYQNQAASAGTAGQIADGSSVRYVSSAGIEYNQFFTKGLIGALMLDQCLNNYLSPGVLDAGSNREEQANGQTVAGKTYTNMEHKWDEAYGYVFGLSAYPAEPLLDLGQADGYLNKYLARVDGQSGYQGIAKIVFDAFKLGRAAIVAEEYQLRDRQADLIRQHLSKIIAVRAIYYLESAATAIDKNEWGGALHDLSEAYGFIYSLRFTQSSLNNQPYLSATQVQDILNQLTAGQNGFWSLSPTDLHQIAEGIAIQTQTDLHTASQP